MLLRILSLSIVVILWPAFAFADVVWPALYFSARMLDFHWAWVILMGLVADWPFYHIAMKATWKRSILGCLVANAISTILGIVLIPISGLIWEFTAGQILYHFFNIGTFNPITWGGTVILAALVNSLIEAAALRIVFKIPFTKRVFLLLLAANTISVLFVFISLMVNMPRM